MESDYKLNKTMGKKPWERLLGGKKITACRKTPGGSGAAMQFAKVALRRPVGPSWRSLAPVSYTHLDVYKRQMQGKGRAGWKE